MTLLDLVSAVCDVTDPETVKRAVAGSRAVIFAASASPKSGSPGAERMTPARVDNEGGDWPHSFTLVLDRIFGKQHLARKCFWTFLLGVGAGPPRGPLRCG